MFTSGLQAASFMKATQVVEYSREALAELEQDIVALSTSEDLPAHGRAVTIRSEAAAPRAGRGLADGSRADAPVSEPVETAPGPESPGLSGAGGSAAGPVHPRTEG